jgi:putative redox protein
MKKMMELNWNGKMLFNTKINGHDITMDAYSSKVGGEDKGPPPKPLMLVAMAGCTGQFISSLLKKMKVDPDGFRIIIEAEETDDHPKYYKAIHQKFAFRGKDLDKNKIEKAVDLAENRYCGVTYTYRQAGIDISSEIQYE